MLKKYCVCMTEHRVWIAIEEREGSTLRVNPGKKKKGKTGRRKR